MLFKKGITVLNSPGTIDADYRGEVGVILINLSSEELIIEDGQRIAQMVITLQNERVGMDRNREVRRNTKRIWRIWKYWNKIRT